MDQEEEQRHLDHSEEHSGPEEKTELEKEIFGSSGSDESDQEMQEDIAEDGEDREDKSYGQDEEEDDLVEEPSRRSSGRSPKPKGASSTSDKILEARKEFDEAMDKIKSTSSRKGANFDSTGIPVDLDDIAERFVKRMAKAADADYDAVEAGKPALEKQKMLPEVIDMLTKRPFHEVLLDNDLLGAVRRWLEPMPNRTLPSPNIRKAILEVLKTIPVETVHLRESGLGKIVNFFTQRPGEVDDIRRLANELVTAWSRPILQRARRDGVADSGTHHTGQMIKSESLKGGSRRRYSGGTVETRQQRKIVQSLAAKKRSKKF